MKKIHVRLFRNVKNVFKYLHWRTLSETHLLHTHASGIHPSPFMHILHTQKWWPSAWACRLWFPEPWREKRGVYKVQQLITKKEHFQQTINNHGLFNRWKLNHQTEGHVFGEEKKCPKKETRGRSKAACGALLVRALCLPVCARSGNLQ